MNEKYEICIIGKASTLRSASLARAVCRNPSRFTFQSPVYVETAPSVPIDLVDQRTAETVFGRKLSPGEVGCWHAHRKIYQEAARMKVAALLILEDDAEIVNDFERKIEMILRLLANSSSPRIVSLYSGNYFPTYSKTEIDGLVELKQPPTHTTAYIMNAAAVEKALSVPQVCVSTADWPTWSPDVDFYIFPGLVSHGAATTIGDREQLETSIRRSLRRLSRAASPRAIGRSRKYFSSLCMYVRWVFIYPARRRICKPAHSGDLQP